MALVAAGPIGSTTFEKTTAYAFLIRGVANKVYSTVSIFQEMCSKPSVRFSRFANQLVFVLESSLSWNVPSFTTQILTTGSQFSGSSDIDRSIASYYRCFAPKNVSFLMCSSG